MGSLCILLLERIIVPMAASLGKETIFWDSFPQWACWWHFVELELREGEGKKGDVPVEDGSPLGPCVMGTRTMKPKSHDVRSEQDKSLIQKKSNPAKNLSTKGLIQSPLKST